MGKRSVVSLLSLISILILLHQEPSWAQGSSGGSLVGSLATPVSPVNLTSEGTSDWAHWGLNDTKSFDHKAGVTPQISNYILLGTTSVATFDDNLTAFTWSDGTPTTSAINTQTGVYVKGLSKGFQITLPADTTSRTLRIYLGLFRAQGKLVATLSDESAPDFTDTALNNPSGSQNGVYTINYRAASSAQTLTLNYTATHTYDTADTPGNVTLQAATLASSSSSSGGSLVGSLATPVSPVNLTNEGTSDWAHWGLNDTNSFDHKAGVTPQISNYTLLGTKLVATFADNLTAFTWSDGTPTTSAINTQTGVYVKGLNKGFQITLPADTTSRTLRIYLGLFRAQGKLVATLSDGSAPDFTDTALNNPSGSQNGVYTINYRAASSAQTLTLNYTAMHTYDTADTPGNVTLQAATLAGGGGGGGSADDFNGDGKPDLVWQNQSNGSIGVWFMDGSNRIGAVGFSPGQVPNTTWKIVGIGDFNADSKPDLVWQNQSNGSIGVWFMDGSNLISTTNFNPAQVPDTTWKIVGVGDFNADSKPDLVWQNQSNGSIGVWFMDGINLMGAVNFSPGQVPDTAWKIVGIGDFNADSKPDLVWQNQSNGSIGVWFMDGINLMGATNFSPGQVPDTTWKIVGVGDFNADSKSDLVWQNQSNGSIGVWFMDGINLMGATNFSPGQVTDVNWKIPNVWALISNH